MASPVFHNPGQAIILRLEGVLSYRLEVFSLEWLLKVSQPNLVPSLLETGQGKEVEGCGLLLFPVPGIMVASL